METLMNKQAGSLRRQLRVSAVGLAVIGLLAIGIGDAFAGRGGGRMANTSVSGANRAAGANRASAGNMNRANTGNVNRGNVNTGNVNRGNVNTGNVNRGNVNTGNVNRGNVNVGNDINIDIDNDYGRPGYGYGGYYHPVATAAFIGAVAVTTAAVVGSYYYALPPGCTTVIKNGVTYHYCGTVYYQKTMSGNDVVYVVVNP
jgi:hypothetical protein